MKKISIKKSQVTEDAGKHVEKEEHSSIADGIASWYNHSGKVWQLLRKLDIVLPEDLAIPLLGIYPEDAPTYNKDICSIMFKEALFIIARNWNVCLCFWQIHGCSGSQCSSEPYLVNF